MIGGLIGWLAGSRRALAAAKWGAVGLTILLFLLSVVRTGERAAGYWRRRLAGLVLTTSWLGGCATGSSEPPVAAVCPPVVEYTERFRAQAMEELELLPEDSAIVEMLSDYAVMREQARVCWANDLEAAPLPRRMIDVSSLSRRRGGQEAPGGGLGTRGRPRRR